MNTNLRDTTATHCRHRLAAAAATLAVSEALVRMSTVCLDGSAQPRPAVIGNLAVVSSYPNEGAGCGRRRSKQVVGDVELPTRHDRLRIASIAFGR